MPNSNLPRDSARKIVNLNLYKAKKALLKEGFEVIENPQGKITLVIRIAK